MIQSVILNSKNRNNQDENIEEVTFNLPNGWLKCHKNEYIQFKLDSFAMPRTFFNVIQGFNNQFEILKKDSISQAIIDTLPYNIPIGNYDTRTLRLTLNNLLQSFNIVFTYQSTLNNWLIQQNVATPNVNYYIQSINAHKFLGLNDNEPYLIDSTGLSTPNIIYLNAVEKLLIEVSGDINIEEFSISNMYGPNMTLNNIIAFININDIPSANTIIYGSDNYYRISNRQVNNIKIRLLNEYLIPLPRLSDWYMNIVFEKKPINNTNDIVQTIKNNETYLIKIYMMLNYIYDKILYYIHR